MLLSLTSCWSTQEINDLAIIHIVGIDEDYEGNVVLTVSVVKPNKLFSQGTDTPGNAEESFLIHSATGKNLFEAMGKLSSVIPEKIYLGHVDAVVFGAKAAHSRMETSLDFFKRQNDFRPNIQLFVTKGFAEDIIKKTPVLNPSLAIELQDLALFSRFAATTMVKDISKFTDALTSDTIDPITGVISLQKTEQKMDVENSTAKTVQKMDVENSTEKKETETPEILSLHETAAFKGGSLQGFLDQEETRGLQWIQGELKNANIILNCGSKDNLGTVSLHVTNSSSQMVPKLSNGKPKMTVNIQTEANIVEITCKDLPVNSNQLEKLNKQFEAKIREDGLKTLRKAQYQWETDIFGFGRAIYRKYPQEWDQLAPRWRKGGLRSMDVELKVSASIARFGLSKEPSKANESR
jgi:spore germination protein KC